VDEPGRAIQPPPVGDGSFDEFYFRNCCGDPYRRTEAHLRMFAGIADRIVADIHPATVLDAGCAIGLLVEVLRDRGVDACGIDLSSYAISQVDARVRDRCRHASIVDDFDRRYDLIVSIEVLEHIPARDAEAAIANFCRHTDDVLFSSSPLDYREPTHVNVHPPEHWAAEFARHGFYRDVDFDASFITPWAARFRRSAEPVHRLVRSYERRFWELSLERNHTRSFSMELQTQLAQRQAEVERLRAELSNAESNAATAATELAQANDRIVHMERSLFWRARRLLRGG
jgi:hypothetical protein